MQFLNEDIKKRIAYLASLTLLFSYAELFIPRFLPFFRLGLGNTIILLAFDLPFIPFLFLAFIKSITASIMNGTLFSPFVIISLGQSIVSGMIMYILARVPKKLLSLYGISLAGSAISTLVQILLTSLYLGKGIYSLLGVMLLFSIFSGIVTAFLAQTLKIPTATPELISEHENKKSSKTKNITLAVFIIAFAISVFFIKNILVLTACMAAAFILQKVSGRKILILPHLCLWSFIVITTLLIPTGKVLFHIGAFPITQDALLLGIQKSLRLSCVSALSQCTTVIKAPNESFIGLVFSYYNYLIKNSSLKSKRTFKFPSNPLE